MPERQQSLDEIFLFIKKGVGDLRTFVSSIDEQYLEVRLQRLRETADNVGAKPKVRPPPMEIYLREWEEYAARRSDELSRGALRYLCWEPAVAPTHVFLNYILRSQMGLDPRSLQGLVRSCHQRWDTSFARSPILGLVKRLISEHDGLNQTLTKWRSNLECILGPDAPHLLASRFVASDKSLTQFLEEWHLDTQSPFVQQLVSHSTELCREELAGGREATLGKAIDLLFTQFLPWEGWELSEFKNQVSNLILESHFGKIQDLMLPFILGHKELGDPRLPRNRQKWLGIQQAAIARLLELLCKEDIAFFFDHVIPTSRDRQNRKQFWLQYVSRCTASRPLLGSNDRIRLKPVLQEKKLTVGHFGNLKASDNSTFLLNFNNITVVDFSKIGACFVYHKKDFEKIMSDFWANRAITEQELKQGPYIARILHITTPNRDWRNEARQILATHGIRP